jgi:hypothetical protein
MTKAIAQTYNIVHEYRARITLLLLSGCIAAILIYAVNVYMVISRSVALGKITHEVATLSDSVSALDARSLDLESALTPDTLSDYGLQPGTVTAYIPRTAATAAVWPLVARSGHEL